MTRFFAHLCLFLQMIDIPVPPLATQVILEAYLQVLEVSINYNLILNLISTVYGSRVLASEISLLCMLVLWGIML